MEHNYHVEVWTSLDIFLRCALHLQKGGKCMGVQRWLMILDHDHAHRFIYTIVALCVGGLKQPTG